MVGFERDSIEFSGLSRMSDNLKAPARKVQEVCRNTRVKKALQKLVASNTSADRGEQWGQVSKQFSTNCDTAQRIILTPTPTEQLLKQMDPEYTKSIADRVLANANNSSNELNKLKKERANLVAGRNSIDEDPTSVSEGGKRRRRNKTNRKNRNRKTRKNRRNRN
jgi:hypothetical protein